MVRVIRKGFALSFSFFLFYFPFSFLIGGKAIMKKTRFMRTKSEEHGLRFENNN